MLMQRPRRQCEDIALAPIETLSVDDREAGATYHVVHGAASMAMRPGVLAGSQLLNHTGHRRQYGAAGLRMSVFEQNAILSAAIMLAQSVQCFRRLCPGVEE